MNSIGSFFKTGSLFFSPTITRELLECHSDYHNHFKEFNDNPNSLYLPNNWVPHCTIANRLSSEKLVEAYRYCLKRNEIIKGKIKEVAIIEIVNKNSAPVIYSIELLNSNNY